ncbi:MAG: hypothetical protein ACREAC_09660, partial [Blastocatellia bacterium]
MKPSISLVEQLRRVDELAFLNWETYEEDLMKRLLISSVGVDRLLKPDPASPCLNPDWGVHKAGPISFSTFREFRANQGTEQHRPNGQDDESSAQRRRGFTNLSFARGEARVTDEEVLLGVAKREARRRAQRDLYILMLYYPGQHVLFNQSQIEGMLKAAGIDESLPTSQLIVRALELYRESGAPPMNYGEWPQVILDQPALAKVPALTESERIHLLALEASLAVIDRVRATELAHAGIDPE